MKTKQIDNSSKNLIDIFIEAKKFIGISVVIITIFATIYAFLATTYYSSYISIYRVNHDPNYNNLSGFANIASSFGVNLDGNDGFDFYIPDIVESRSLKEDLILKEWEVEKSSSPINLIDFWEIDASQGFMSKIFNYFDTHYEAIDEYDIKMNKAIEELESLIQIEEKESGLFVVSTMIEEPKLSKDIANYIASYIKKYISDHINEKSYNHKIFINERLEHAKKELTSSENILMKFQENHFLTDENPKIQLERARLLRNVEVNQQVYLTLRQQQELAEISYLKEKPIVNILDNATIPPYPEIPKRLRIIIAGFLFSLIISIYYKYILSRYLS